MKYNKICSPESIFGDLEKACGCEVRRIPFFDTQPNTNYYISKDGENVWVGMNACGHIFVNNLKIYPAGYRSPKSLAAFKRRNVCGMQPWCSIASAVFGAFKLGEIPRFKVGLKDGNTRNNSLSNIVPILDTTKSVTLNGMLYRQGYSRLVNLILAKWRPLVSKESAEDIVSEAFIKLAFRENTLHDNFALWRTAAIGDAYLMITRKREFPCTFTEWCPVNYQHISEWNYEDCLTPRMAQVIKMFMDGYNQTEIAEILGCNKSNISSLQSRAFLKIKTFIERNGIVAT